MGLSFLPPQDAAMNFLTLTFLIFFPVTLLCRWLLPRLWQPVLLLLANAVFTLWAGPVPGLFLAAGILVSWGCGFGAARGKHRRLFPALTLVWCFGQLFVFKYLEPITGTGPGLAMPLGISFYSFTLVGYVLDVYRGKLAPERNLLRFAVFGSFFPSLLSGPINRAGDLLPQLRERGSFDSAAFKEGLWRFLTGAAKKLVVADLLGAVVDAVYADPLAFGGGMWLVTAALYSLQIFVDFSAYSDMAVGTARMLGVRLTENFRAPYLSRDVKTFWKRWHTSLTGWFRDYLYVPLGGSRRGTARTYLNVLIVFAVSGIWHGAGWAFLCWGLLNGLFQVIGGLTLPLRQRLRRALRIGEENRALLLWRGFLTFCLITVTWVFFRAASLPEALFALERIARIPLDGFGPLSALPGKRELLVGAAGLVCVLIGDIRIRRGTAGAPKGTWRYWLLCALVVAAALLLGRYGPGFDAKDFVYFRF